MRSIFLTEGLKLSSGLVFGRGFFDFDVVIGGGGDLREMADNNDLVVGAELLKFAGSDGGGSTGEASIDFVEDESLDALAIGAGDFDGEHDAAEFAAGCDFMERLAGFSGVGGELEFDEFLAGVVDFFGLELEAEFGFVESELANVGEGLFCEIFGPLMAEEGEGVGEGFEFLGLNFELLGEIGGVLRLVEELVEFGLCFGQVVQNFFFTFSIFLFEAVDEVKAGGGGFDGFGVVVERFDIVAHLEYGFLKGGFGGFGEFES